MKTKEFNKSLMEEQYIFNKFTIKPGMVIEIYRCDVLSDEAVFVRKGIVSSVSETIIKYTYYDKRRSAMETGYLTNDKILVGNPTPEQWEAMKDVYIFKVEEF